MKLQASKANTEVSGAKAAPQTLPSFKECCKEAMQGPLKRGSLRQELQQQQEKMEKGSQASQQLQQDFLCLVWP